MPLLPCSSYSVLFVGNSLTYCNDLDLHVKAFMEEAAPGMAIQTDRVVKGGASLKTLWTKTDAKRSIASGGFDTVVLQEDLPETNVASFHEYARRFHEVIKAAGSRTVFLMTWPYKRLGWITTEGIAEAHQEIAVRLGAEVAPAGLAWQRAQSSRIRLYGNDGEHPSPCGTYLAAAVAFSVLWRRSPVGLTCSAARSVSTKDAKKLQEIAWATAQPALNANEVDETRSELVKNVFQALDVDADGLLNLAEMRRFETFIGFRGDEAALKEEFDILCAELGGPITLARFQQLVDRGTQHGLFATHCTSEELQELQAEYCKPPSRRVVIVPGNGGGSVWNANWYGWLAHELQQRGVSVALRDMPDPVYARETRWLPYIIDDLAEGVDKLQDTIFVGHSSGAAALMRLAEKHRVFGMVLVSAYTSDLGDATERKSGYFARPWKWAQQRENCDFIAQFASTDDPFLPMEEQLAVKQGLAPKVEYHQFDGRSHFFDYPFWELLRLIEQRVQPDPTGH